MNKNKLLANARANLTESEYFNSQEFKNYLNSMFKFMTRGEKAQITVIGEQNSNLTARTDGKSLIINWNSAIQRNFPTFKLKVLSVIGMFFHKVGHILYTDFNTSCNYTREIEKNGVFIVKLTGECETKRKELEDFLQQRPTFRRYVAKSFFGILNIIEDIWMESKLSSEFAGTVKNAIVINRSRISEDTPTLKKQIKEQYMDTCIVSNLILTYASSGLIPNPHGLETKHTKVLEKAKKYIDAGVSSDNVWGRVINSTNVLLCMWDLMLEEIKEREEQIKEMLNQNQEGSGSNMEPDELDKAIVEDMIKDQEQQTNQSSEENQEAKTSDMYRGKKPDKKEAESSEEKKSRQQQPKQNSNSKETEKANSKQAADDSESEDDSSQSTAGNQKDDENDNSKDTDKQQSSTDEQELSSEQSDDSNGEKSKSGSEEQSDQLDGDEDETIGSSEEQSEEIDDEKETSCSSKEQSDETDKQDEISENDDSDKGNQNETASDDISDQDDETGSESSNNYDNDSDYDDESEDETSNFEEESANCLGNEKDSEIDENSQNDESASEEDSNNTDIGLEDYDETLTEESVNRDEEFTGTESDTSDNTLSEATSEFRKTLQDMLSQRFEETTGEAQELNQDGKIDYQDLETLTNDGIGEKIAQSLTECAEEKLNNNLLQETQRELVREVADVPFTNWHKNIDFKINRHIAVSNQDIEQYSSLSGILKYSKALQKALEQTLKMKPNGIMRKQWLGKKLDKNNLYDKQMKVFAKKNLPKETNLAVSVLIDQSGSMSGRKIVESIRMAVILEDFCRKFEIPLSIAGHSWTRCVEYDVYKDFEEIDKKDKYRLMQITPTGCNRDGAALQYCGEHLLKRPEDNKLLILLSDGQPNASGYSGESAKEDLKAIKKNLKNRGVELFAAAIDDDKEYIKAIYGDGFLDMSDLNKLPKTLVRLIESFIL